MKEKIKIVREFNSPIYFKSKTAINLLLNKVNNKKKESIHEDDGNSFFKMKTFNESSQNQTVEFKLNIIEKTVIEENENSKIENSKNENSKNIYIITSEILLTTGLFLQKTLLSLGIETHIIFFLDETCIYDNNTFYIILFNNTNFLPKKYIFWQIEQTEQTESPINKFDNKCYMSMNNSISIFEISIDNIKYYENNIINKKKILYTPLPFYCLNTYKNICEYEYDIVFFGAINNRRRKILNNLISKIGNKYKIKVLFGIHNKKRDEYLIKSKYVLNIHYYESAKLECDRFNISINCNCLILSENCIGDEENKNNYKSFVKYFDNINNYDNLDSLIDLIHYNLQDDIFLKNKENFELNKKKLQEITLFYLHKNLLCSNIFEINYNIDYTIIPDNNYCISLLEDYTRYKLMVSTNINIPHIKFPALKIQKGYIGCAMSYYTIIYNCKKQNINKICIFEDDVLIKDMIKYNENMNTIYDFLSLVKWDIFNGYVCIIEESDILDLFLYKNMLFFKLKKMVGTVFNIYNNSIYDNILNYRYKDAINNTNNYNTDFHIDRIINNDDINIYICYPYIFSILPVKSTLDMHNNSNNDNDNLFEYNWFINETNKSIKILEKYIKNNVPKIL
jgi:hypothetical protein